MAFRYFFGFAAIVLVLIGVLHFIIAFAGGDYFRYFGAGENFARLDEAGSLLPMLITIGLAVIFFMMAAYSLSVAGYIKAWKNARIVVLITGVLFTLRGLVIFIDLVLVMQGPNQYVSRDIWFSLVALLVGLSLLSGLRLKNKYIQQQYKSRAVNQQSQ